MSRALDSSETNLSTKQPEAQAAPRVSCADGNEGGSPHHQKSASQAAEQAERLSSGSEPSPRGACFPRSCRLTRAREFERVFSGSLRSSGEGLRLLAVAKREGGARLGMAIARRRVRKAVCRSRIRRVIRESFREHHRELGDLDIVVLARSGLDHIDNATLRRLLAGHWRHLARRRAKARSG